ncbi:MAG: hypothetical protein ACI4MB_02165 [Candidatus Coproplasma sp.]
MKDNRTENLQATANAAEAEVKEEIAAGPKKFKDVQALVDAYTALEAEFTRRSQRLKELEANKEQAAPAQAASAQALSQAATEGSDGVRALSQQEKNAVIEEYLNGVYSNKSVPFITVGGAVKAARVTPKTIGEAASLAKRYFENKEN